MSIIIITIIRKPQENLHTYILKRANVLQYLSKSNYRNQRFKVPAFYNINVCI